MQHSGSVAGQPNQRAAFRSLTTTQSAGNSIFQCVGCASGAERNQPWACWPAYFIKGRSECRLLQSGPESGARPLFVLLSGGKPAAQNVMLYFRRARAQCHDDSSSWRQRRSCLRMPGSSGRGSTVSSDGRRRTAQYRHRRMPLYADALGGQGARWSRTTCCAVSSSELSPMLEWVPTGALIRESSARV